MVEDNFRGEDTVVTGWGNTESQLQADANKTADILQVYSSTTLKISLKNKFLGDCSSYYQLYPVQENFC